MYIWAPSGELVKFLRATAAAAARSQRALRESSADLEMTKDSCGYDGSACAGPWHAAKRSMAAHGLWWGGGCHGCAADARVGAGAYWSTGYMYGMS
jgi:hypothetical protein